MSSIGPALPPHLAQGRKTDDKAERPSGSVSDSESDADSDSFGPQPPKTTQNLSEKPDSTTAAKKNFVAGPSLPPNTPSKPSPPKRVAGPTLPPGLLEQRPSRSPTPEEKASDSESDDEYGPSVPIPGAHSLPTNDIYNIPSNGIAAEDEEVKKPARAEWMTLPPSSGSPSLNFDPSRHRARAFNTKPTGIGGGSGGNNGLAAQWTETPEEKRKRLANEVLGISSTSSASGPSTAERKRKLKAQEDARTADRVSSKRRNEESLLDSHVKKQKQKGEDVEEDDPSKRAFDWEKDMNAGFSRALGGKDRKDMVKKATSEFGGRFSGGGYL